jgi:hypothetical protein
MSLFVRKDRASQEEGLAPAVIGSGGKPLFLTVLHGGARHVEVVVWNRFYASQRDPRFC